MLIRSQNKKCLVDMTTITIQVSGMMVVCYDTSQVFDDVYICLGTYESEAKAMKVLDMIQEAYADAKLNEILLHDVCKAGNKSQQEKENTSIAKVIRNTFMKKMVFQIPEDSKVEV
jgi:hypothetical protein